jgi:hypothetical protein
MEVADMSPTTVLAARPTPREYVRAVLRAYIAMPETLPQWHSTDRRMALELFGRQIPLELIEAAFLLGSARRLARNRKLAVPPIRSLAYFLPVIEEVLADPPPHGYIQYLRRVHLQPGRKTSPGAKQTTPQSLEHASCRQELPSPIVMTIKAGHSSGKDAL